MVDNNHNTPHLHNDDDDDECSMLQSDCDRDSFMKQFLWEIFGSERLASSREQYHRDGCGCGGGDGDDDDVNNYTPHLQQLGLYQQIEDHFEGQRTSIELLNNDEGCKKPAAVVAGVGKPITPVDAYCDGTFAHSSEVSSNQHYCYQKQVQPCLAIEDDHPPPPPVVTPTTLGSPEIGAHNDSRRTTSCSRSDQVYDPDIPTPEPFRLDSDDGLPVVTPRSRRRNHSTHQGCGGLPSGPWKCEYKMNHESENVETSTAAILPPKNSDHQEDQSADLLLVGDVHGFGENVIVFGSNNSKNPLGVTKEYRLFKQIVLKKRTTVADKYLYNLFYPEFLKYLHELGKCTSVSNIDDLHFVKQKKGNASHFEQFKGDRRDNTVIEDIKTNNTIRTKRKSSVENCSLEKMIADTRVKLAIVKSTQKIDVHVHDVLESMLRNMESLAPLNESTKDTFKDMIVKNWNWFIKRNMNEKRKSTTSMSQERDTDPDDENFDDDEKSVKKNKGNPDGPASRSGPSGTETANCGTERRSGISNPATLQNAVHAKWAVACSDWDVISSYSSSDDNDFGWDAPYRVNEDHFQCQGKYDDDSFNSSDNDNDDDDDISRGVGKNKILASADDVVDFDDYSVSSFSFDELPRDIHIQSIAEADLQNYPSEYQDAEMALRNAIHIGDICAVKHFYEIFANFDHEESDTTGSINRTLAQDKESSIATDCSRYFNLSVRQGHLNLVRYFYFSYNVNVMTKDDKGKTAMHYAANIGHLRILQFLIVDCGADIESHDKIGRTPLHEACITGKLNIVLYLLLVHKAQVDRKSNVGFTALFYACQEGHLLVAKALFEQGHTDVNAVSDFGTSALHRAIRQDKFDCVRFLLEVCNAKIFKNKIGWKGIHIASSNGSVEIVTYLVNHSFVNVEDKTNDGMTALHIASNNGRYELVKSLIQDLGADVEAASRDGFTSLHIACSIGNLAICEYLLNVCHASIKTADNMGRAALHIASIYGHHKTVTLSVNAGGVDELALDNDGYTAIQLAKRNYHDKIAHFLSSYFGIQETTALPSEDLIYDAKSKAASSGFTPKTGSLTNDSESVRAGASISEGQEPIVRQATSETSKNEVSKYFLQFWTSSKK